jgi:two-component system, OmpR family, KDP operon response regulator KdpE
MEKEPSSLLLIDDDVRLTEGIARFLRHAGYRVDVANDGVEGLEQFRQTQPDLVVLDVMMPGMDGLELCRRLHEQSQVPIIMLTARGDETDRVHGLRLGADDYITKPFSLKELEARIEAVLRRARSVPGSREDVVYDDGSLRLEARSMQVLRDGAPLSLTATERRLLFLLAEQAGRVFSPEQILRQVWGNEYEGQTEYVKLYVWRVRQKVEPNPDQPSYIRTERGLGYRFVPQTPA